MLETKLPFQITRTIHIRFSAIYLERIDSTSICLRYEDIEMHIIAAKNFLTNFLHAVSP